MSVRSWLRNRVVLSLETLERRETPSVVGLDPTFGNQGRVWTAFGADSALNAVALQADGKVVVAGESGGEFALARYNPEGSLDASFDHDGKVLTPFGGADSAANAVAIQPDGKIVVAGESGGEFALARYNSDGSLDPTFHGDGTLTTPILADSYATSIALQPDGKIVVVGTAIQGGYAPGAGQSDVAVVRYNTDGSLDTSFDHSGTVTTYWGANDLVGAGVVVQPDGKIVVAGTMTTTDAPQPQSFFVVLRYNADSTLDRTFHGGSVRTDVGPGAYAAGVALQADGKIVVAGDTRSQFGPSHLVVARYAPDGGLDFGFGTKGIAAANFGASADTEAGAVAVQPDGKIVVAGQSLQGAATGFALARFTADGHPDAAFAGGAITVPFGAAAGANALVIQADGKAVAAGDGGGNFALARIDLGPGAARAATQTTLTATPPALRGNQPVVLTATIQTSASTSNVPTGYVVFKDGGVVLGVVKLNAARKATWTYRPLGVGRHTIQAFYQGDDTFAPSTSLAVTVNMTRPG